MKSLLAVIAALAAVALVVAGCGSSSDSTTDSTATLTKAEFVKQGNKICEEGNKSINAEFEEFSKENNLSETEEPPKAVQVEGIEQVLIPNINGQIEEVKALGTPEGDEGELEELIAAEEEVLQEAEEEPTTLFESTPKQKEANKLATEYGLTVCGEEEGTES